MLNFVHYAHIPSRPPLYRIRYSRQSGGNLHSTARPLQTTGRPRLAYSVQGNIGGALECADDNWAAKGRTDTRGTSIGHGHLVLLRPRPDGDVGVDSNEVGAMNARRNLQQHAPAPQDVSPPPAQTPPPSIGMGHPEYHFVTGLLEIQKQLGETNSAISALTKTVDSTKAKVDDLVAWKNRILGGAFALGAVCALLGFFVSKFSSYVTFKDPETTATVAQKVSASGGNTASPAVVQTGPTAKP